MAALLRTFGVRGGVRRARYELGMRTRRLERTLLVREFEAGGSHPRHELFDLDRVRAQYENLKGVEDVQREVVEVAENFLQGQMRFYGADAREVGWPPRWHVNPWTGHEYPRLHWTRISDVQSAHGDIKDVWEISRLPFTFTFARAYALSADERWAEAWWTAVEDWARENPLNLGVNWRCGQETSLRGIALQFGVMAFGSSHTATDTRRNLVSSLIAGSVERVESTLHYALSQRNNHSISEAVFLEASALLGYVEGDVARRGRKALVESLDDQFYEDGWYAQSSLNYQRLALHALLWLVRVRSLRGLAPITAVDRVLASSATLLRRASDPRSGTMPNVGPNDEALLFPLTTADRHCSTPVIRSIDGVAGASAPADEEAIWIGRAPGRGTSDEGVTPRDTRRRDAHVVTLTGPRLHAVVRSGRSRHRTQHDDLLHMDVWIDGNHLLGDAGTYRYVAPKPWGNPFTGRSVHNVPFTTDEEGLVIGNFLNVSSQWAEVVSSEVDSSGVEWVLVRRCAEGQPDQHRAVAREGDLLRVVDFAGGAPFRTRWNVMSAADVVVEDGGTSILTAVGAVRMSTRTRVQTADSKDPTSAWISDNYSSVREATVTLTESSGAPIVTQIGPKGADLNDEGGVPVSVWLLEALKRSRRITGQGGQPGPSDIIERFQSS